MRKDMISKESYDDMVKLKDLSIDWYKKENDWFKQALSDYGKLQNENGYLKALFDKEGDTQVIKYNGKLYKIVSATNYIEPGVEKTLDISLVLVREVG